MVKKLIDLKGKPFRIEQIVVEGRRTLRKIHCKRVELLVSDQDRMELQFRFYIKDGILDVAKANELEDLVDNIDRFSWIGIDNKVLVDLLRRLFSQYPERAKAKFLMEFCFTNRRMTKSYEVAMFYEGRSVIMVRR